MPIGSKLVILLSLCLTLNYQTTQANPSENRVARSSNDLYDWLTSLFDYEDSEETLLCRNCTVVVNQDHRNGTDTTATPATAPPTAALPTNGNSGAPNGNNGAPNGTPTTSTAAPTPPPPPADATAAAPPAAPAEG